MQHRQVAFNIKYRRFKSKQNWKFKLFGVKFDHKFAFDQNIKSFCKKAKAKLKALARIVPYIVLAKKHLLINSFFAAQFNYYHLIWMIIVVLVITE